MKKFSNLSIQNKILLGIGLSFILAMILLLIIVIYQFNDLSAENQSLIKQELLERKYDKYESLVKTRASILAEIYQKHLLTAEKNNQQFTEADLRELVSNLNKKSTLNNLYFYIYDLDGNTVSLPPSPGLEGQNRMSLQVDNVKILVEMIKIIKATGGGRLAYPYLNPNNGKWEQKYSYVQQIGDTDLFIGSGGYQSSYQSILDKILAKIFNIRDRTIYLLLIVFIIISAIIGKIIFEISKYIKQELQNIIMSFKRVEKGQLNFELDVRQKDEFGSLAIGFNKMLKKINQLTYNDPLTGLPNLNFLENNLRESIKENSNNYWEDIYLFTLSTDNLTIINSNYGYQKGNIIIKEVYQRLRKSLAEDFVIARKNDEFIFYFVSQKDRETVKEFASQIINNLSLPYEIENNLVYLKIKIGIVARERENCQELIRKSRLALLFVDEKNSIKFYQDSMLGQLSGRLNLESKLRRAISKQEFILFYQPQLETKNNNIVAVEALIRWYHPAEGMISPGQFIPLAEDTGMILEIGDWVLHESLKQLKKWENKGFNNLTIAVNIAPQQFQQDKFVLKVKELLNKYNVSPSKLELEITERTVIKDVEYTVEVLNKLKFLGVKISIDDFGTGYSSLEYLNRFALDKLKIDKSFVHDQSNLNIVRTIIMMGSNLGLQVVAEGVETASELEFLIENNCKYYQGFYYTPPKPAFEIEKYF
jgi:diguanylate cyclase (GGDEF)-like protein